VPDCLLETEVEQLQDGEEPLVQKAGIASRNEDEGEAEELVVSALAVRALDITEAPLCDKPCRYVKDVPVFL
jgi:hypothetical protein